MLILKILVLPILAVNQPEVIEPPPSQAQTQVLSENEPESPPASGSSTYSGTITPGAQSMTNVEQPSSDPSQTQTAPSGTASVVTPTPKLTPSNPEVEESTPNTPSTQACSLLQNPDHIAFAAKLDGNELILFCSIFDDAQRDQVLIYAKNEQMEPKDAVVQVGKDAGLLFSQTPGGACGAH